MSERPSSSDPPQPGEDTRDGAVTSAERPRQQDAPEQTETLHSPGQVAPPAVPSASEPPNEPPAEELAEPHTEHPLAERTEQPAVSFADTEPTPVLEGTPEPVVSEAPTELALDLSPASNAEATVHIKRATLASASLEGDPAPEADLRKAESYVGYIIDGRYHILEVLAKGGMGVVYKGRHRIIDKAVAIKVLRPELADNREITQRFLTEAQAASAIGNEHIVDITDYGELPEGATYIVMEFLEGEALSRRVAKDKRLSVEEIIAVMRQAAEGLQGAHKAGIVHRDLKPDNIFLTRRGKDENFVKVLDFGIAKVASSQNQITRAGHIFGTPHYMSPEQAKGDELDNRSDIYSMGVILYELVSGRVPFDGENPLGILTQHMYTEPTPLHAVSEPGRVDVGLEAIVSKCLLKEPWQRYGSMAELDEDLERLQQGVQPLAVDELRRMAGSPESLKKRIEKSRSGSRAWMGWALVLGMLGGAAWFAARIEGSPVAGWVDAAKAAVQRAITVSPEQPPEPTTKAEVDLDLVDVAMVLSPIDAHVYRGKTDLGPMPLTVRIRRGHKVTFNIKREGYVTQRVVVDGLDDTKLVELAALPGTTPPPRAAARPAGARRFVTITDTGAGDPAAELERSLDDEIAALLSDGGTGAWLDDPIPADDGDAGVRPTEEQQPTVAPVPTATTEPPAPKPSPAPAPLSPVRPAEPSSSAPRSGTPKAPTWLSPKDKRPAPGSTEQPIFDSDPHSIDDLPMERPEHPDDAQDSD